VSPAEGDEEASLAVDPLTGAEAALLAETIEIVLLTLIGDGTWRAQIIPFQLPLDAFEDGVESPGGDYEGDDDQGAGAEVDEEDREHNRNIRAIVLVKLRRWRCLSAAALLVRTHQAPRDLAQCVTGAHGDAMPIDTPEQARQAPWWTEFLDVKDGLSWAALRHRFGASEYVLRRALSEIGLSKKSLPPGRKRPAAGASRAEATIAPARQAEVDPLAQLRQLAGTLPDAEVARRLGMSVDAVKSFRQQRGIRPYLRPPPVAVREPHRADAVVVRRRDGADARVAARIDVPAPAPSEAPSPQPHTPEDRVRAHAELLGTVPDAAVAARAGVHRSVVGQVRHTLGIAGYTGHLLTERQRAQAAPSGHKPAPPPSAHAAPAAPAAEATSAHPLDAYRHLMGTVGDQVVAEQANVSRNIVGNYRRKHGIAAFEGYLFEKGHRGPRKLALPEAETTTGEALPAAPETHTAPDAPSGPTSSTPETPPATLAVEGTSGGPETPEPAAPPSKPSASMLRHRRSKMDRFVQLIGVEPDAVVAERAGVTTGNVRQWRLRRGIPAAPPRADVPVHVGVPEPEATMPPLVPERAEPAPAVASSADEATAEQATEPSPAAVPRATQFGYTVVATRGDETRRFAVTGTGLVNAAMTAARALEERADGPWVLVAVRQHLEALV
jgi:hypothetical protein